jgi:hypothetical protein
MKDSTLILDRRRAQEFHRLDRRLVEAVDDALAAWPVARCRVSSIHRTDAENAAAGANTRIHVVTPARGLRAVDLSGSNVGGTVEDRWRACGRVAAAVNRKWVYDPSRPRIKVAFAAKHGTGPHVHLQVHRNTRRA